MKGWKMMEPLYTDQYYAIETGKNYLEHFGIKGMKWGIRRFENEDGTLTEAGKRRYAKTRHREERKISRQARKDAEEFARAKMFYGEGAGNRRKLIKAAVKQRSSDPFYKAEFERYLSVQDMAKHAEKARGERKRRNAVNTTAKTARGVKNAYLGNIGRASTTAIALYGALKYTGADKKIAAQIRRAMRRFA